MLTSKRGIRYPRLKRSDGGCIRHAPDAIIVVRSTVPVGFMAQMQSAHPAANLYFGLNSCESRGYVDNVSPIGYFRRRA